MMLEEEDHARAAPLAKDGGHAQRSPLLDLVDGSDPGDMHDQDLLPRLYHLMVTWAAVKPFLESDPDHIQHLPGKEHEDLIDQTIRRRGFPCSHAMSGLKKIMQGEMHPLVRTARMLFETLVFKSKEAIPPTPCLRSRG